MKKTLYIAALTVVCCLLSVDSSAKKFNPMHPGPVIPPVQLNNSSDSLSYAAGKNFTNGLIPFLQQQGVDTVYMADFIQGFKEACGKKEDPRFKAYSAGAQIAQMVQERMIPGVRHELEGAKDSINVRTFERGFTDALQNDSSKMTQKQAEDYFAKAKQDLVEQKKAAGKQWLAENAKKPGVVTLPSGLQYKVIKEGKGPKPARDQKVSVMYEGHLIDGTEFDSSYKRNKPTEFRCDQVIKGWTEALTMMPEGSTWEIYVPENLGYGERPSGKIPPYSTLIFTVELQKVLPKAAPKADAKGKVNPKTVTGPGPVVKTSKKK